MPYFTTEFLILGAAFVVAARFAPAEVWPWLRDGLAVSMLAWFEPRALVLLVGVAVAAWAGSRWAPRRVQGFWAGLVLIGGAFLAVRIAQREGAMTAPIGFGFLALRLVHWWVEDQRSAFPAHGFREFFAWLIYLPTVFVGPVQRFEDWLRWERRRRWDDADAALGLRRIVHGYAKVAVLSFWFVGQVLPRALGGLPPLIAGTLLGTASLYFTFSGVSDIAIGLGRIAGQRVPENFRFPFLQPDLPSFWRSWHMTVSEWARTYVYYPLLARTRSARLSAVAGMAVFALWHELSLAYVAWGAWHALGLALWYRAAELAKRWALVSRMLMIVWVLVGFYLLRAWPRGDAWYAR